MPTHRRQGVLTRMMQRLLDDVVARGEPVAMLWASESNIYGRFGYGLATSGLSVDIERKHAVLRDPVSAPGRLRMIDHETAKKVLPEAFDRFRRAQPGSVSRTTAWWSRYLSDPESERNGHSALFFIVHETARGVVDGFASYRMKRDWSRGTPEGTALIDELIASDPLTRTALWLACLDLDLTAKIHAVNVPVDEPLRWQLADARRFKVDSYTDNLWVRPLDIPTTLSSRTYAAAGHLVFDVRDTTRADTAGRYELEGNEDGAVCKRTRRKADLTLDVADLGAISLGGVDATTLARAGRVTEVTKNALQRADAMFACTPAPWCNTDF